MIVYTRLYTPRLIYITRVLGEAMSGEPWVLTTSPGDYKASQLPRLNYSDERLMREEVSIVPHPLLFQQGVQQQDTGVFMLNQEKAFFPATGDVGFDLLAAAFYLVTRYEEYLPHPKDEYGRYAHTASLAYRHEFLDKPLVNTWLRHLRMLISAKFPDHVWSTTPSYRWIPTYDIDIAWSLRYKDLPRTIAGMFRGVGTGNLREVALRRKVMTGKAKDPYDSFEWLQQLHRDHGLKPIYFFLLAARPSIYDKNNPPKYLSTLTALHARLYHTGIHPSWRSGDEPELLAKEKQLLEDFTGRSIHSSRQHYIRFTLPGTFRRLIMAGIRDDYSMGYGSINGFRASICTPYNWYDIDNELETSLRLHPFCFMDANSFYEQRQGAGEALEEMTRFAAIVRAERGEFISIWHNHFLGTARMFRGWREAYEAFVVSETGVAGSAAEDSAAVGKPADDSTAEGKSTAASSTDPWPGSAKD